MLEFDTERDPIDVVAEDFAQRCRQGERPSISTYLDQYPELADKLRTLLPPVAKMEQWKRQRMGRTSTAEAATCALKKLGDYRILGEVGRGGMGIVYEAIQESLGRRVALKILPKHSLLDKKKLERFEREAQAAARLHHTNIVPVFGVGEADGLPYYFMQFIAGKSWQEMVTAWKGMMFTEGSVDPVDSNASTVIQTPKASTPSRPKKFTVTTASHATQVARMGMQAALALDYAHEQGTLHRDIKPSNFMLDEHGTVWVTDFGLAKLSGRESLTSTGDLIGTLNYMSPESFQGENDARSDIYSLGLTLYELATLQTAFNETDPARLIKQVSEREPARPSQVTPDIPHDLETIILKAIARNPKQRYQTARELADDLQRFLEGQPIRARRSAPLKRMWRWCRRHQLTCLAVAASLLAVVLAVVANFRTGTALVEAESAREAERKTLAELCLARLTLADVLEKDGRASEASAVRREAIAMSQDARLASALSDPESVQQSRVFAELAKKLERLKNGG